MKNKKIKFIAILIGLFLIFSGKVSAEVLEQFSQYTEPQFTTEMIDSWYETYSIDKTVYDSYLITLHQRGSGKSTYNYYYVILYKSTDLENGKIYIYNDDNYYYIKYAHGTFRYSYNGNLISTEKFNLGSKKVSSAYQDYEGIIANNINSQIDLVGYYSNRDIKDQSGNVILSKNDTVESEEEPITIINKMSLFVNDIIVYFNENNISFYQILIGLFLFNFLVYVICYIVRRF